MSYAEPLEVEVAERAVPTRVKLESAASVRAGAVRAESISIVFPAFNEEANIEKAVRAARDATAKLFAAGKVEIIVVDDGSTDRTRQVLERIRQDYPELVPLYHPKNRGYGAAVRTGLYAASNELVFFTDSDLQFDLNEIEYLLEHIADHEIVAGYRGKRADPFTRKFNAWGWNKVVRVTLGVKVRDIDCAFKLFRRDIFDKIDLTSVGAMINTELLAMAAQQGMRVKEVRVSHFPRVAGQQTGANLRVIMKAFKELAAMRGRLNTRLSRSR
jgi:glycosyltransferase involved in cell wall biosynthesis